MGDDNLWIEEGFIRRLSFSQPEAHRLWMWLLRGVEREREGEIDNILIGDKKQTHVSHKVIQMRVNIFSLRNIKIIYHLQLKCNQDI